MAFTIICESSTDLPKHIVDSYNIKLLPMKYMIGEDTHLNDPEHIDLPVDEFYQMLKSGSVATTSQLTQFDYQALIEEEFKKGKDVLILGFSSGLSGSINGARLAIEELKDQKQKALLIDTLGASLGQGFMVYLAAKKQQEGATLEETYQYVESIKHHVAHWFTVDDLMFLKRGGRVSGVSAVIGTMLSIKPILHVDDEGKLIPRLKVMGRKKALQTLVDKLKETIDVSLSKEVFISHGCDLEAANRVKDRIEGLGLDLNVTLINEIGPVIGAHSGPGTVAVFFTAHKR